MTLNDLECPIQLNVRMLHSLLAYSVDTSLASLLCICTRCHAIAKTTARCAQYMSALKIVCKHRSSRRLRKNLHITILSLFGGEIIFEVFQQM